MEEKRKRGRPKKGESPSVNYVRIVLDDVTYRRLRVEALVKSTTAVSLAQNLLTGAINGKWQECQDDVKNILRSLSE